jgi:hypothetical protein
MIVMRRGRMIGGEGRCDFEFVCIGYANRVWILKTVCRFMLLWW